MNYCLACTIFLLTITSFSSAQLHLERFSGNEKQIHNTRSDTTYDIIIGETYQCMVPANGWRRDTTILSDHSRWYKNPFVNGNKIEVSYDNDNQSFYYYQRGFLFTGMLHDTLWLSTGTSASRADILRYPNEAAAIFSIKCYKGVIEGVGQLVSFPKGELIDQKFIKNGKYLQELIPIEEHNRN